MNKTFDDLVLSFKALPGISKKQAEKISFYLTQANSNIINNLISNLENARNNLIKCKRCNFISEDDLCIYCSDKSRADKLMIVESNLEVNKFENLKIYHGQYFVLDFLVTNIEDLEKFKEKYNKILINAKDKNEVILSTSPTLNGEMSAIYIKNLLKNAFPNLKISQLANGLPIGSQVEYIDNLTLDLAFKNRKEQ